LGAPMGVLLATYVAGYLDKIGSNPRRRIRQV
jgi:hypothetical protein